MFDNRTPMFSFRRRPIAVVERALQRPPKGPIRAIRVEDVAGAAPFCTLALRATASISGCQEIADFAAPPILRLPDET
jgi:hypothetical protein